MICKLTVFQLQLLTRLNIFRVNEYAFDWANLHALRHVKMPHALGAKLRRDVIQLGTGVNRAVWAHGLANIAVDALVGDKKGHESTTNG